MGQFNTRLVTIELHIPKVRNGGYIPDFIEPYQRSEKAFLAVIREMYIGGVFTRKTTKLMKEMGIKSMSASEVSRINK